MKLTRQFGSHSGCSEFALLHAKYTQWNDKSDCLDIEMILKIWFPNQQPNTKKQQQQIKKRKQNKTKQRDIIRSVLVFKHILLLYLYILSYLFLFNFNYFRHNLWPLLYIQNPCGSITLSYLWAPFETHEPKRVPYILQQFSRFCLFYVKDKNKLLW